MIQARRAGILLLLVGCAHTPLQVPSALKGEVLLHGTVVDAVERRLSRTMTSQGWTVVYQDTVHVYGERPGTREERASLSLNDTQMVSRRLECDVKQEGVDVVIAYHTVRVIIEPSGESRVSSQVTTWDDRAARENHRVFESLLEFR